MGEERRVAYPSRFATFFAVFGIDQPSGGNEGAQFTVYLDGFRAERVSVAGVSAPSIALEVDLGTASVLGLATNRVGTNFGNHAAWADARLERVNPVPLPGAVLLFGSALLTLGCRPSFRPAHGRRTAAA